VRGIGPARPLLFSDRLLFLQFGQVREQTVEDDETTAAFVLSAVRDPNTFDRRLAGVQRRQDQRFEFAALQAAPRVNDALWRQRQVPRTRWKDELLMLCGTGGVFLVAWLPMVPLMPISRGRRNPYDLT